MPVLFLHCNGGHYYQGGSHCPHSGYTHPLAGELLDLAARTQATHYGALLAGGASEAHLTIALFVPDEVAGAHPWPCGAAAPAALVELVQARNQWLIMHFPAGQLAVSLVPRPRVNRRYARIHGETVWRLVETELPAAAHEVRTIRVDAEHAPAIVDDFAALDPRTPALIPDGHLRIGV